MPAIDHRLEHNEQKWENNCSHNAVTHSFATKGVEAFTGG
jgi:hypothetical protein